jgi:S1-C subfamily serine protease
VGRQHAKIVQDNNDPTQFTITDMNSRNGTYLNKQRIVGTARIVPGDVVQFGAGGPEFQFDLEPRPAQHVRPTREASASMSPVLGGSPPPTRTGEPMPTPLPVTAEAQGRVGKATVERMIADTKRKSNAMLFVVGGGLMVVIVALVAAVVVMKPWKRDIPPRPPAPERKPSVGEIAQTNANTTVYIECGWKLYYTSTGGQLYHRYIPNVFIGPDGNRYRIVNDNRPLVAAYLAVSNEEWEPLLTDTKSGYVASIGGEHSGTGFTVTSDGFILTNRHVAAAWRTSYDFPDSANPGVLVRMSDEGQWVPLLRENGAPMLVPAPQGWVPANSKLAGQRLQGGFDGRNDYLDVTFAKNELRFPAKLARVSDRHDVAMIKIDTPEPVAKVELFDNYESIKLGDSAIVLGYPGVSPKILGLVTSQDVFNPQTKARIIPDPTVSVGNIGRVIRAEEAAAAKDRVYSMMGDAYQLTINSTGAGNSGGPVFDEYGRAIGIFFAGSSRGGATITFAVPIRYGKELMTTTPIMK